MTKNYFYTPRDFFPNIHAMNLFFNVGTGEYLQPHKIGYAGRLVILTIIKETRQFIFEPYKEWLQSGEQRASYCRKCGQENLGIDTKFYR